MCILTSRCDDWRHKSCKVEKRLYQPPNYARDQVTPASNDLKQVCVGPLLRERGTVRRVAWNSDAFLASSSGLHPLAPFATGPLAFPSSHLLAGALVTFLPTTPFHNFYRFPISKHKSQVYRTYAETALTYTMMSSQ